MAYKDFTQMSVWEKAFDLLIRVYKVSKKFPDDERFGMISDMRRAANSTVHITYILITHNEICVSKNQRNMAFRSKEMPNSFNFSFAFASALPVPPQAVAFFGIN